MMSVDMTIVFTIASIVLGVIALGISSDVTYQSYEERLAERGKHHS